MSATKLRIEAMQNGPTPRMPIAAASTTYEALIRLNDRIAPAKQMIDAATNMAPQQVRNPERSREANVSTDWKLNASIIADIMDEIEAPRSRMPTMTGTLESSLDANAKSSCVAVCSQMHAVQVVAPGAIRRPHSGHLPRSGCLSTCGSGFNEKAQ